MDQDTIIFFWTLFHEHCENPNFLEFLNELIQIFAPWYVRTENGQPIKMSQEELIAKSNDRNFFEFVKTLIFNAKKFPHQETIFYRDFKLELVWNVVIHGWTGYISVPHRIYSVMNNSLFEECLNKTFHYGISYQDPPYKYGMDCGHCVDYNFCPTRAFPSGIYRTKEFALHCLINAACALDYEFDSIGKKVCHQ